MGEGLKDREFAKGQIRRLVMLKNFPRDAPEAVADLVDALMKSPTEDIARDAISSWVLEATTETVCPFPADIRSAVQTQIREQLGEILPDPDCVKCNGDGEVVERDEKFAVKRSYKCDCYARRKPVDWSKRKGVEKVDMSAEIAAVAEKLRKRIGVGNEQN